MCGIIFRFPFSSCLIGLIIKVIVPLWNVSSLWSNCYLAFLGHSFFQQLIPFIPCPHAWIMLCMWSGLKFVSIAFFSEWDLLYLGFFLKRKKAKLECCCWPWHQITRQTLYSYVWILTKCDAKANRVLARDPPGQQSYGAFLYCKSYSSLLPV